MPLYEYQCQKCRATTEVLQKSKDKPLDKCPKCGGPVAKLISSPAIQFKGDGWYITDYAKKSGAAGGAKPEDRTKPKAETTAGSGEAAKKTSEKADKSDS